MYKEIDFNKDIDFNLTNSGYTYFKKEKLVLLNFYSYNGPILCNIYLMVEFNQLIIII